MNTETLVALSLNGISLSFGGISALRDVELIVLGGEIHSVIGPNGAGKSSLLNIMTGIYRPDAGTIRVLGETFAYVPAQRLASLGVARTFQNIALFNGLSVLDNIAIGLTHRARATPFEQVLGLKRARREADEAKQQAAEMIRHFDLVRFQDRKVALLPYGVQKRVELARALIARPKLLLLDEPMAGMTAGEKTDMCGYIVAARDERETTIVLVEHDMGVVMGISDRVTVLDHGVRIADGTPAEIQTNQVVVEAYLGIDDDAAVTAPREAEMAT